MKIDIHTHVSIDENKKIGGIDAISADEMISSMDDRGIDISVLMSSSFDSSKDESNEECFRITQKYPNRFKYMCVVDTKSEDVESQVIAEKNRGAIGIGELVENLAFNDEQFEKMYEAAQKHNMPILFHVSTQLGKYYGVYDECGLVFLEEVLAKYPDLIFIGHSQAFWFEMTRNDGLANSEMRNEYPEGKIVQEGRVQELLKKYPNLYCDLSANSGGNAIMRDYEYGIKFLNEFSERLFFGTDIYNVDQHFPLQNHLEDLLVSEKISKEVYDNIFYKNIERIFNI